MLGTAHAYVSILTQAARAQVPTTALESTVFMERAPKVVPVSIALWSI